MAKILGIVRVELLLLQEEASDAMYMHHIPMMDNATALDVVSKILTILDRYNLSQDIVKPSSLILKFNEGFPLEQKNKIKSALANLILKNDSKGEEIQTKATVERVQEKSFFNFLWINIAAVLKQILI